MYDTADTPAEDRDETARALQDAFERRDNGAPRER